MQISVKSDIKEFSKWMNATQKKHLKSGIRNGLNETAFQTMKGMRKDLPKYVDRPTSFTTRGLQYSRAEKTRLTARVGFVSNDFGKPIGGSRTKQADYMSRLAQGGIRLPNKRSIPVPVVKNYKTNKHGNLRRNALDRFFSSTGDGAGTFFIGRPRGAKRPGGDGVFKRGGRNGRGNIKMQVVFEDSTKYTKSYPFEKQVKDHVRQKFRKSFEKQIQEVMNRKGIHYFSKYKLGNIL